MSRFLARCTTHAWTGCSVTSRTRTRRVACSDGGQDADPGAVEEIGGEEVQRQDPLRLGPQKLGPPRTVAARRWIDPGVLKDLPDRPSTSTSPTWSEPSSSRKSRPTSSISSGHASGPTCTSPSLALAPRPARQPSAPGWAVPSVARMCRPRSARYGGAYVTIFPPSGGRQRILALARVGGVAARGTHR